MNREEQKNLFHDLKNDMASMTALLNLHKLYKESISNEDLINRLFERQSVISLAYERLYQDDNYPDAGLVLFINELLSREDRSLSSYNSGVKIVKDITPLSIHIKKIIPLGQILIELITNSYRHAFKNSGPDKNISFAITEDTGMLTFCYVDNGCGFPEGFIPSKTRTLGMQFIISLTKQLGTKPLFNEDETTEGMSCRFSFKI